MRMQDVRAVVTGGASGLGRAVADEVIATGGRVALLDVNEETGQGAAKALGARATFFKVDVTSEQAVDAAIHAAAQAMDGLSVAVNCAGVGWPRRMVGKDGVMPGEFFRKVVEINLVGTLLVCKAAAAAMQHNEPRADGERGVIVMTASVAAFEGQIGQAAYSASKGGVAALTLPAAREFAQFGIRVNAIAPGIFHTPMLLALPQEAQQSLAASVPFPKLLGRPDQFATLARHIIENTYINGEVIRLDGALRLAPR